MARPKKTEEITVNGEQVLIELTKDTAVVPEAKTEGAGCMDITLPEDVRVPPVGVQAQATVVPLGFKVKIPKGHTMRIQLRSSVGRDYPIALANTEGIVDEDFRGEVVIMLRNFSKNIVFLEQGQRIAQCWLEKTLPMTFVEGEVIEDTERGNQSGSTGK
nr:MAG TPA: dUTPase [Caudoviricetes sp.]